MLETDAVFLATPAGVSSELTPKLMNQGVPIIDLSGDLRIQDGATYEAWYKRRAYRSIICSTSCVWVIGIES
ncbi:hypothetical protein ACEQPO_09095 [Bacillus sp. SL00103]